MRDFSEKQQQYIEARAAGAKKEQAAIQAGYSPNGASVAAAKLERMPKIKAAIASLRKRMGVSAEPADPKMSLMKPKYKDSLELMQHTYNNPKLPPVMRFEAAKQALPYEHARIGEKGKKEQKDDAAKAASKRPRFASNKPPALRVVK